MLIPSLPLAAAVLTALLGPKILKKNSHLPTLVAVIGSLICSLLLVAQVAQQQSQMGEKGFQRVYTVWTWAAVDQAGSTSAEAGNALLQNFKIDIALRADALTAIMLATVTLVSSLVVIYSIGYMHGDRGYWRFFTYLSLFVFSMTMLVAASNFVLLFVFWEAVGLCSYFLIGFWYQKPSAAAAGKKAFLVNRVGDFGFTLAMFLIWTHYGTLDFHSQQTAQPVLSNVERAHVEGAQVESATASDQSTSSNAGLFSPERIKSGDYASGGVGLAICLLLMVGACGKSAQFPLHIWLPDAMEGPSPVSALIHAATMVTAGVYMVTRCTPMFVASADAQIVVACIGGFTALMAALIAMTQFDLKRVLAYSTISQLGYMFLALGTGTLAGVSAGMFHLFTHAFFKALLFLGAGSVMHAMGDVIDMRRFGGLRHRMPITHWTFLLGCLALAGVFPLSGFWSKDAVVAAVHDRAHELGHSSEEHNDHASSALETTNKTSFVSFASDGSAVAFNTKDSHRTSVFQLSDEQRSSIFRLLYGVGLLTAALTAFYTFRAFFMTFYGEERIPHEAGDHAHESPRIMWGPLAVLAVGAVGAGMFLLPTLNFAKFLGNTPSLAWGAITLTAQPGEFHLDVAAISTLIALSAVGVAAYLYLGDSREIGWLAHLMQMKWVNQLANGDWAARLEKIPLIAFLNRLAQRVGLGWLASLLSQLLLLVLSLLAAPLMIGYFVSPYRLSSRKFFIDEIYHGLIIWPLRILAAFCYWIDRHLVDGLVNFCGQIPLTLGSFMRRLQMGLTPFYALAMVLGALLLIAVRMVWAAG